MSTFIPFTSDVDIIAIGHGLVDRTLPKIHWTHTAHFAAALWLMERLPRSMSRMDCAYNESTARQHRPQRPHETITLASMRAAGSFRNARSIYHSFESAMT